MSWLGGFLGKDGAASLPLGQLLETFTASTSNNPNSSPSSQAESLSQLPVVLQQLLSSPTPEQRKRIVQSLHHISQVPQSHKVSHFP